MKSFNLSSITKKGSLDARQSASLIINSNIAEIEEGKGFLTMDEKTNIRDSKDKDTTEYNRLIDLYHQSVDDFIELDHLSRCYNSIYLTLQHKLLEGLKYINLLELIYKFEHLRDYGESGFSFDDHIQFILPTLKSLGGSFLFDLPSDSKIDDYKYLNINKYKPDFIKAKNKLIEYQNLMQVNIQKINDIAKDLGIAHFKDKADEYTHDLQSNQRVIDKLCLTLHTNFSIQSNKNLQLEAVKKRNLSVYKHLTDKERKMIDNCYPDFSTELIELDEELVLCKLFEKNRYQEIIELLSNETSTWYANVNLAIFNKLTQDQKNEGFKSGDLKKTLLFTKHPKLKKRWLSLMKKIKIEISERKFEYDGYFNKN